MSADDGLRALFFKHLPKPEFDWSPIETGGVTSGVPDAYWASPVHRVDGWVECKATTGWALDIRPHQAGWLKRRVRAGVRCTMAVRARGVGSSRKHGDALWLLCCSDVDDLLDNGLQCHPDRVLGVWYGPPRAWDWKAVARLLLRPPIPEMLEQGQD